MQLTPTKQTPISIHTLEVGKFTIYQNIIVVEFNEGVHVNFESASLLIQTAQMAFGAETPIVYISHRINSYSVSLTSYKEFIEVFPNYIALGIVAKNKRRRMLAKLERFFVRKPIQVFNNMNEAFEWAEEMLENTH